MSKNYVVGSPCKAVKVLHSLVYWSYAGDYVSPKNYLGMPSNAYGQLLMSIEQGTMGHQHLYHG